METLCRGWAGAATGFLALGWTWMYTAALPEQVRRARREEIRSDLHDQMVQYRMERGQSGRDCHRCPSSHVVRGLG